MNDWTGDLKNTLTLRYHSFLFAADDGISRLVEHHECISKHKLHQLVSFAANNKPQRGEASINHQPN
jgi:hypothetical protein